MPQFYDYEDEVIATTQRPVQPPRPKFQQPQYSSAPVPPRPQFANAVPVDVTYANAKPQKQAQPQFESFENRQPAQFPQNAAPAPAQPNFSNNRPADFPLFTPANSRADVYKPKAPKVRSIYKISHKRRKSNKHTKRKKKNIYFVVRKKRRYYY